MHKERESALLDYHVHALGHGTGKYDFEDLASFFENAREAGIKELGFAEHDVYLSQLDAVCLAEVGRAFPEVKWRLGLEVSYAPGREQEIAELCRSHFLDYVVGSVHEIDGWMFDHPDYQAGYTAWDSDLLYETYFRLVAQAVNSGFFDVAGHLDLIKVFGCRPWRKKVEEIALPLLVLIARKGLVVEVNTSGLYKPVGEIYPSRELLMACFQKNIPVTLGSDAHRPEEVGRAQADALRLAREVGYTRVVGFRGRKNYFLAI